MSSRRKTSLCLLVKRIMKDVVMAIFCPVVHFEDETIVQQTVVHCTIHGTSMS